MKCNSCSREVFDLILNNICFDCWARLNPMQVSPEMFGIIKQLNDDMIRQKSKCVQVQFFTGKLQDISRQMNKFFKEEKIGKDRLVEIKITKGAVMVVYE